jgi:hypothetical protein
MLLKVSSFDTKISFLFRRVHNTPCFDNVAKIETVKLKTFIVCKDEKVFFIKNITKRKIIYTLDRRK